MSSAPSPAPRPAAASGTAATPAARPAAGPGLPGRVEVRTPPPDAEVTRRTALKLLSATALLGLEACTRKPRRKVVSVAEMPEYRPPGAALHYASTLTDGRHPYGILVKSVDGRPVKVEGLPEHPLSRGASTAAMQATLLSLYDPERLRTPLVGGAKATWEEADRAVVDALKASRSTLVVTRSLLGPTERAFLARFLALLPGARHLVWESAGDGVRRAAWREAYGADGVLVPDLAKAAVVLCVDSDPLGTDGDVLSAVRGFAARRVVDGDAQASRRARLWVAESGMTVTGSSADQRIPLRPRDAGAFVRALLAAIQGGDAATQGGDAVMRGGDAVMRGGDAVGAPVERATFAALAGDLREHRGEAVVLAGPHLPPDVHAAVALLNDALGAPGTTGPAVLSWNPEPYSLPSVPPSELEAALAAGPEVVLLLGVNPVHDAPPAVAEALARGKGLVVGHGLTRNETLERCRVALPSAHALEGWNDAVPCPGVVALAQPLIAPLFDGRQEMESLLAWAKALAPDDPAWKEAADWHDVVRARWATEVLAGAVDGERAWQDALRRGFVGEERRLAPPPLRREAAEALAAAPASPAGAPFAVPGSPAGEPAGGVDVVLAPHPAIDDGRLAGNAWLLELPHPVSLLVWDNAAEVAPATARRLGLAEGDHLRLSAGDRSVVAPVLLQPGTAPDVVVLPLGFGRTAGAGVGDRVGVNAAPLLGAGVTPHLVLGAGVARAGGSSRLVRTVQTFDMHDRPIARDGTVAEYREDPGFARHRAHVPPLEQLHAEWDYSKGRKWAMAVDLSACIGCGACTIACQAENNIPVVGKDEVSTGREMSWIRIDRYEEGGEENPTVHSQPMLCQHCDNAPCESVCPVNATSHSPEGLNEQTYNRCVGTRYCGNNCPYKVRRFNFFAYAKRQATDPVRDLLANPQVTVRSRGVMEKCTFCVQRIHAAKFAAANAGTDVVPDGAIVPACAQACPARALVFGDANLAGSAVAAKLSSPLGYRVLEELNVRPNVTYLARVRHPHPDLAGPPGREAHR